MGIVSDNFIIEMVIVRKSILLFKNCHVQNQSLTCQICMFRTQYSYDTALTSRIFYCHYQIMSGQCGQAASLSHLLVGPKGIV